jgi:hypothetical protein
MAGISKYNLSFRMNREQNAIPHFKENVDKKLKFYSAVQGMRG